MHNNMRGFLRGPADSDDEEAVSPTVVEAGNEDSSLNIKVNQRKMFAKPPIMPVKTAPANG